MNRCYQVFYDLRAILSGEVDLRDYILATVKDLNLNAEPYLVPCQGETDG